MTTRRIPAILRTAASVTLLPLLLVLLLTLPSPAAAQQIGEYHIKAVFLCNLTHFVNWPATADREADAFVIGIYGPDPFESILDKAIVGEKKRNRPVKVERYRSLQELVPQKCNILFIHSTRIAEWKAIQQHLKGFPVLTVADVAGFPEMGGMVNLLKDGQKIQVEINHNVVQASGISVSSKLLNLARIVP